MVFSLQKRFLLFLLLPVAIIVTSFGFAGFVYSRGYLLDQWLISVQLQLEQAAHEINMSLEQKLELITLISKADEAPNRDITQAFLIQELLEKPGVRFVDVVSSEVGNGSGDGKAPLADDFGAGVVEGLYTMEVCGEFGFCAPILDPNALDRSLKIIRILKSDSDKVSNRLIVRISFDSFLEPIKQMGLMGGGTAWLITSTGQFLASTDKAHANRKKLGDTGDLLEKNLLKEIRNKPYGKVFSDSKFMSPPEIVAGFYKIPSINWYVVLLSRGRVILEPIIRFRTYYALAGLLALGMILLLIRITTRSVAQSISEISSAAIRVQDGDYSKKLPETRSDEIGQLTRSFNGMIDGLKERDLIEQTFGRYVDKKIAQELMSRPEALRLGGEKGVVTIMMSDLRDFTVMSEKLPPEVVIKMLNRYFSRMIEVIERYRGIIVDFYGDSILVFFNGVESSIVERALDAVNCALDMQEAMRDFVSENLDRGLPNVSMGIGINTGEVVIGNIGTESRAKYGIVGSDVNLTDRIQSTANAGMVVVSETTYKLVEGKFYVEREFEVCLKGVEESKRLYELQRLSAHTN
ncbi:MAG: adenylate/guanylate cyclase domain-containing protein [Syntrophaceae bacterium]|nr:adenylate/guanylate cyclase domain-containing protein [Syntrophaceae bacterium]